MFSRIVVPLDGSETSEKALPYAQEMAEKFVAPVTIVRAYEGEEQSARTLATMSAEPGGIVDPRTVQLITDAAQEGQTDAERYVAQLAQRLTAEGLQVDTHVSDAAPATAILEAARGDRSTLIVMSTHGRGGLSRAILGSVANDVIKNVTGPVLLVRVFASSDTNGTGGSGVDIRIGAEVMGTTGKLGDVSRVIVDSNIDQISDIVVKHGFIFGSERVVPLGSIKTVEDGVIFLDVDERGFEAFNGFTDDRYRAPDPSYLGPPGFRNEEFLLDTVVAAGPVGGIGQVEPVFGFPGGQQVGPDDMARPAVGPGTNVMDVDGEKVGDVHELSVSSDGSPTRLVVKSGFIFKHETEVPVSHIKEISDDGILLSITKADLAKLGDRA